MFRLSSVSSKLLLSVAISVILATALMIAIVSFQVASYSEKEARNTVGGKIKCNHRKIK
ncbi:hypothetical protein ACDL73_000782 [Campylobacter jejuni]